ncbi:hypothetical protein BS78_06G094000 [Paspalum vaginatum]|nr:hypothetical protein BS78_06G094000 [Paspalum vaginatum]
MFSSPALLGVRVTFVALPMDTSLCPLFKSPCEIMTISPSCEAARVFVDTVLHQNVLLELAVHGLLLSPIGRGGGGSACGGGRSGDGAASGSEKERAAAWRVESSTHGGKKRRWRWRLGGRLRLETDVAAEEERQPGVGRGGGAGGEVATNGSATLEPARSSCSSSEPRHGDARWEGGRRPEQQERRPAQRRRRRRQVVRKTEAGNRRGERWGEKGRGSFHIA